MRSALVCAARRLAEGLRTRVAWLAGAGAAGAEAGARVATWAAKGELTCLMPLAARVRGWCKCP